MTIAVPRHDATDAPHKRAETFFDALWREGDPWGFDASDYDQASYREQVTLLSDRRYPQALEIGCGAGSFTKHLAPLTDRLLALDVAPAAIASARESGIGAGVAVFRVANIMESDAEKETTWDLIVLGETIYYVGWLYPLFDVYWLAQRLFAATRPGARLLMTNTSGGPEDYLQHSALIRTYRDLFLNVGYEIVRERALTGLKNGSTFTASITVFGRPLAGNDPATGTGS